MSVCKKVFSVGFGPALDSMSPARNEQSRVQVVLTRFSVRLLCFFQTKTLYINGCIYFLAALVLVCVDVMVMSSV